MQKFEVADILRIEGTDYLVIGWIRYRNPHDSCEWIEYRMKRQTDNKEAWLSIDDAYHEYSISFMTHWADDRGFHVVDTGTEVVSGRGGNVDVSFGERAKFTEMEDTTEEQIISIEDWSDGREVSTGHYLDENEIQWVARDEGYSNSLKRANRAKVIIAIAFTAVMILICIGSVITDMDLSFLKHKRISKYLKNAEAQYSFVTATTGPNKTEALVYESTLYNLSSTATDIIDNIEGDTQFVQQDTTEEEDGSIAILTKDEYCLVYVGEDGKVYVQVSSREYTYQTDSTPYHSTHRTSHYYRDFYYGTGYSADASSSSISSPYTSYDGSDFSYSGDSFTSYSNTVRQASISARSSSSGGISAGK